jgi:UDP-N-acetylmuramate--alanine ligase
MTPGLPDPVAAVRFRALALQGLARSNAPFVELPGRLLVVDVAGQRLGLFIAGKLLLDLPVSTAAGIGGTEGSFRTPPGWHRIQARIGAGAVPGTVFRSRVATGEQWQGEATSEDLILTRILTLEGLEEGINRGPGVDSLARYIYLHGTNREDLLGFPVSHGCLRLANADVIALSSLVQEGDPLVVAELGPPDALGLGKLHFAGVGGSGMSALAAFVALKGGLVSGSDRAFDRGQNCGLKSALAGLGIQIQPQDGSGVRGDCAAVIGSTAVEAEVPDLAEAARLGVPILHRSELLAHLVSIHRSVAITGTSGKSTTAALVFELLRGTGLDPSLITGADLVSLQGRTHPGNAFAGKSNLLVIEADESDGSLVRYAPAVGVVMNLQKDHRPAEEVMEMFRIFSNRVQERLVLGEAPNLAGLSGNALVYGHGKAAELRGEKVSLEPEHSTFQVSGVPFMVPLPGAHNVENALAALAACRALGVPLQGLVAPLAAFKGVARRFQVVGRARGVEVVDDFAHNPAKLEAALRTAQARSRRVLAVFQPHGFGPLRFLRADFVESFVRVLRPQDKLWFLDVFFAGGTVTRDISSVEVVAEIAAQGAAAAYAPSRDSMITSLVGLAQEGDLVLVMGARDPSLSDLASSILASL